MKTYLRICNFCKKPFDAYIYNVKRGYGKYCSKTCSNRGNGFKFSKGHPDFRKTPLSIIGEKISRAKKNVSLSKQHKRALSEARKKYYDIIGRKKCRGKKRQRKCYKCIEWRKKVFERDNYTCVLCGITGIYLEADHIKAWVKYPKLRHVISNGRALCRSCHMKTPNYKSKAKIYG